MSNIEERVALADLPELPEENTDLDYEMDDERIGNIVSGVPGISRAQVAPPPSSGRGIGRPQDDY
jgi:hypothetical protein